MSYQSTEVYRYLIFLQKYLLGDLSLFHKLSKEAEQKEKANAESSKVGLFKGLVKLFKGNTGSPTLTITTTKYPYSFESMFVSPIIPRSTIPHTATLFSTIDILGFLNRREADFANTTKNIEEFFSLSTFRVEPVELTILTTVFRHGMTHNYFPKLNMEVSYRSSNPTDRIFFKNSGGDIVLNVNLLEVIVTEQLQSIINNSELYENMINQFEVMTRDYELKSRGHIEELKRIL